MTSIDWHAIGRLILVGIGAYAALVLLLRVTGKRTLSKWNAFDFIVTVALGSTLASAILSKDITLAQGVTALAVLVLLQYVVTWLSVRSSLVRRLIKAEPTLLLYQGQYQVEALRRERVTKSEVQAALRAHGIACAEEVAAVVLETDGTFSVIEQLEPRRASALDGVIGFEQEQ
jgi:uncharacterized membrane protein YcaP (DUF421 family)